MTSYGGSRIVACQAPADYLIKALTLLRQGHFSEADVVLASAPESADPALPSDQRYQFLLLRAWLEHERAGREAALAPLRQALVFGRAAGLLDCVLCQAPDILAPLCAEALAAGIEREYVHRLIRHSHLPPPSPAVERWPYPVHIHTLGRPAVVVEGTPIAFSGKAQRRPLELLYYLVANGGREVAVTRLIDALWTAEEGAVSRGAFDMALNRLRRLIKVPDAVQLHGGRLSLSEQACWIDRRVLERLLGDADGETDLACALALLERAIGLYQGDFLQGEESGWAILARERLRARLMRGIRRAGERLEEAGRWPEATRLLDRARELFPLDEELCRRLLRSHIQQGEYVQASHLYDRCRELFAKILGVLPSPSTISLINRLPPRRPA
jgi:LuxR family maltose regulon positive regulatory protein